MYYAKFIIEDGRFSFSTTDNGGVPLSKEQHAALFVESSIAKVIVPDANGFPVLVDHRSTLKINDLKDDKISGISAAFISAIKAGFVTTSTIKMNADITDVQRLKSAYDLAVLLDQSVLPVVIDYDNNAHANLQLADVLAMIKELGVHYETLYIKKQTLRGQIMSAANSTELDSIIWS